MNRDDEAVFRERLEIQAPVHCRKETLELAFAGSPKVKDTVADPCQLEPEVQAKLESSVFLDRIRHRFLHFPEPLEQQELPNESVNVTERTKKPS